MRSASGHRRSGWLSLGVLAALVLRARGVPLLLPGCPLRTLTGIPCPTCFLTRSALATLHGDLGEALELHLFGPPLVFLTPNLADTKQPLLLGHSARDSLPFEVSPLLYVKPEM